MPLTLVAASFDPGGPTMYLQFDRAIDVSGWNGNDARFNSQTLDLWTDLSGTGFLVDPVTMRADVTQLDVSHGPGDVLTVPATNGIVAVDDGGTWPGVTDFVVTIL